MVFTGSPVAESLLGDLLRGLLIGCGGGGPRGGPPGGVCPEEKSLESGNGSCSSLESPSSSSSEAALPICVHVILRNWRIPCQKEFQDLSVVDPDDVSLHDWVTSSDH